IADHVCDLTKLAARLSEKPDTIQAIVVIDDFVGTGKSASDALKLLAGSLPKNEGTDQAKLFFIALCGFQAGLAAVESESERLALKLRAYLCDFAKRAFSDESPRFLTPSDRERAKDLAYEKGRELEPKWPVGFGGCEALVVFDDSCPNNTLPIICKD